MGPILPPVLVEESGSGSPDHSTSGETSSTSSACSKISVFGQQIVLCKDTIIPSGDHSASGGPREVEAGSAVMFTSGDVGSTSASASGSGSGSGEGFDEQHSGVNASGSGFISGSGEMNASGDDLVITIVDGKNVEMMKQEKLPEQEGHGGIDTSRTLWETSASGSGVMSGSEDVSGIMSGSGFVISSGVISGSGAVYGSGVMIGSGVRSGSGVISGSGLLSGSGVMSGLGYGELSGISFVDHSAVDLTAGLDDKQEVSGYIRSDFHSGFPSGFPSTDSGSGSASGDQHHGDIIYLTDTDIFEIAAPPMTSLPEQGRGVVEISGEETSSGSHSGFSATLERSLNMSGSGAPSDGSGQSGQQKQESDGDPSGSEMRPNSFYSSPTTPLVSLQTPAVVEEPEIVEGVF